VNSDGVLANLELRDLVAEVGRGAGPGQPKLYATTMRFLQMLGLESLDQLPNAVPSSPAWGDGRVGEEQESSPND
jgi:chromosome segregation and condensation protein ScpB